MRPGDHRDDEVHLSVGGPHVLDDAARFGPRAVVVARQQRVERRGERCRKWTMPDNAQARFDDDWSEAPRPRSRRPRRQRRPPGAARHVRNRGVHVDAACHVLHEQVGPDLVVVGHDTAEPDRMSAAGLARAERM